MIFSKTHLLFQSIFFKISVCIFPIVSFKEFTSVFCICWVLVYSLKCSQFSRKFWTYMYLCYLLCGWRTWVEESSYFVSKYFYKISWEDPRWRLEGRSRKCELQKSKILLRYWSHTWQKKNTKKNQNSDTLNPQPVQSFSTPCYTEKTV
jgi:hypothetical protein